MHVQMNMYSLTYTRCVYAQVNLKGIAVGDPCTDNKAQQDSMDMIWYRHKSGLITHSHTHTHTHIHTHTYTHTNTHTHTHTGTVTRTG
jgi:hypothetical protein